MQWLLQTSREGVKGVRRWIGRAVFEGDGIMWLKGHFGKQRRCDDSIEGLAVDEDFPAARLGHLRWEVESGKALLPERHEVIQGQVVQFLWRFDVDNAIIGMGVHPVETGAIAGNTNASRNGERLTI